jgi:hypothetical protein
MSGSIAPTTATARAAPEWDFNATIIEACSCTMFCQCYFNSKPSGPGCCSNPEDPLLKTRFCRFNNAFQVTRAGGDVKPTARVLARGDSACDL